MTLNKQANRFSQLYIDLYCRLVRLMLRLFVLPFLPHYAVFLGCNFNNMRKIIVLLTLVTAITATAQTVVPGNFNNRFQQNPGSIANNFKDTVPAKKWFISKYAALSTSMIFYNGGHASIMSAPVGIQLNRRLSENWYAFAGVSAAPAYINFNQAFLSSNTKFSQGNNFMSKNSFNLFPRAEMGLMYMNDQKTFSISGSISVERSSYPFGAFNQFGSIRPATYFTPVH